jgi:prepilin-type N-terminal cleavage/methylation domain-containing protein
MCARESGGEDGLTIIELMVALMIFAIIMVCAGAGTHAAFEMVRNNRHRTTGAYLVASAIEQARASSFNDIVPGRIITTTKPRDVEYTVTRDVSWASPSASSPCDPPQTSDTATAYLRVSVQVTWPDMRGVRPPMSETLITPPVRDFGTTVGNVWVKVLDAAGQPVAGQNVQLKIGSETTTQATTDFGCAFFARLTPGTYTASMNTLGWADPSGAQLSTRTLAVVAGQTQMVRFDYDRAANLALSLDAPLGGRLPSQMPIALVNSAITGGERAAAVTGATGTIPVYPYQDGYQVWAGTCDDADPAVHGAQRAPALTPGPGLTAAGAVSLGTAQVTVRTATGTAVSGAQLRAVHVGSTGCASGSGETLSGYAVTDASGGALLALPFGTWTISATNRTTKTAGQVTVRQAGVLAPVAVTVQ